jgi:hypothetical protein
MLYIFLLVAILIGLVIYITIKSKKKLLYSCSNNTCVEDINGKYYSLSDCQNNCKDSINEKFGSFSIGAALKTPIIYNYGNVEYEGVS